MASWVCVGCHEPRFTIAIYGLIKSFFVFWRAAGSITSAPLSRTSVPYKWKNSVIKIQVGTGGFSTIIPQMLKSTCFLIFFFFTLQDPSSKGGSFVRKNFKNVDAKSALRPLLKIALFFADFRTLCSARLLLDGGQQRGRRGAKLFSTLLVFLRVIRGHYFCILLLVCM